MGEQPNPEHSLAPGAPGDLLERLRLEGDLPHLEEALTHPSFANEQRGGRCADNQRLEFLGDAVLGLLVGEILMERFPAAKEGELSLMRSLLVSAEALSAWARAVDLGPLLRLGRGAGAAGEGERDNVLADAAEALIGAVYLDRGLAAARELAAAIVADPLARLGRPGAVGRDPKSELQERVQAGGGASPRYRVVGVEGPDHRREFIVEVEAEGHVLGRGRGRSKKLAEQAAARAAIVECAPEENAPPVDDGGCAGSADSAGSAPKPPVGDGGCLARAPDTLPPPEAPDADPDPPAGDCS
jgi:ribonuclease-3